MFSPFNFQILFFLFTLIIISPAQYYYPLSNTWSFLPTDDFITRLNEAYEVNLFGMIILGFSVNYYDHKNQIRNAFNRMLSITYYNIAEQNMRFLAIIFSLVFFIYVYIGADGIPLINGNRQFSQESNQFIYLLLQGAVYFIAWYFVGCASSSKINKVDIICLILLCADLLFTANRTPPLKVIYAFLLLLITGRKKIKYSDIFKQFKYVIFITIAGIAVYVIRAGGNLSNIAYFFTTNILYGNTFCDIRDGARVLFGYHEMYDWPLMGKTYLASLLSFVPSSLANSGIPILSAIAEFRSVYSGGRWSTYTLFGFTNHYGLRGGMFLPAYMNFGLFGVIAVAILLGYWYGNCEVMYRNAIKFKDRINMKSIFMSTCFASAFFELLFAPAGFNQIWGFLLVLIILMVMSLKIRIGKKVPGL